MTFNSNIILLIKEALENKAHTLLVSVNNIKNINVFLKKKTPIGKYMEYLQMTVSLQFLDEKMSSLHKTFVSPCCLLSTFSQDYNILELQGGKGAR